MEKDLRSIVVQNDKDRLVEGYASVEIVDRQGDIVPSEALQKAMLEYMKRGGLILYGHENKPVGKVLQWDVENHPDYEVPAIKLIAQINSGYTLDDALWSMVKSKQLKGFSIGGTAISTEERTKGNAKVRVLTGLELSEISIVSEPANQGALITAVSVAKSDESIEDKLKKYKPEGLTDDEFEQILNIYLDSDAVDYMSNEEVEDAFKKLMEEPLAEIKEAFLIKSLDLGMKVVKGRDKPEGLFWYYCIRKAAGIPEVNDKRLAGGLCGYIFYYQFNGDKGRANQWALEGGKIDDDTVRKWLMGIHHVQHPKEDIEHKPEGVAHKLRSMPRTFERWREHKPLFGEKKSMESEEVKPEIVEVEKPFAGFKDFAACERKMKNEGYGEKSAKRICGSLKHKYEKGEVGDIFKSKYAWSTCMREQTERYGSKKKAAKVCGSIRAKYGKAQKDTIRLIEREIFKYDDDIPNSMDKDTSPTTVDTVDSNDCVEQLKQNGMNDENAKAVCGYLSSENKGLEDEKNKGKLLSLLGLKRKEKKKGEVMKDIRKDEEDRLDSIEEDIKEIKSLLEELAGEEAALGDEEEELPEEEDEEFEEEEIPEEAKSMTKKKLSRKEKKKANIGGMPREPPKLPEDAGLTQTVRNLNTIPDEKDAEGKIHEGSSSNVTGGIKDGEDNYLGRGSTTEPSSKVETLKGDVKKTATVGSFPQVQSGIQEQPVYAGNEGVDFNKALESILTGKLNARDIRKQVKKIEGEAVFI